MARQFLGDAQVALDGPTVAAAALWSAAFGVFVVVYAPILIGPRADGRPG